MSLSGLTDFLALRPVFSTLGLRLVWFAFLLQQADILAGLFRSYGLSGWGSWYNISTLLFHMLVNVLLVRVLLEAAAAILLRRSTAVPTQTDAGQPAALVPP